MKKLTNEQIATVKGLGFLQNRGTDLFSGRIVSAGTVFTTQNFKDMAKLAEKFGNGKLVCTSRLSVEIPGIAYDNIPSAIEFAKTHGLIFGGTGNKIRPIAACKGTTCVYGNFDTQQLAKTVHENYYLGWNNIKLPHKFKIGIGGCPNSCMKPSLNDFGIEGHKMPVFDSSLCRGCKKCTIESRCPMKAAKVTGGKLSIDTDKCITCGVCTGKCPFGALAHQSETFYKIYVGGTWGKHTRMGTPLSRLVREDEVLPILEKTLLWFRENAYLKERLGIAIDRIGIKKMEAEIMSDDILNRKELILSSEIKER